jgi:acyl carrier protein
MREPAIDSESAILAQLRELVSSTVEVYHQGVLDLTNFDSETPLLSLLLDSPALVDLILRIEQRFNISISDDEAFAFVTVGDVVRHIQEKQAICSARGDREEA